MDLAEAFASLALQVSASLARKVQLLQKQKKSLADHKGLSLGFKVIGLKA
jgi:hypothetical protein